MEKKDWRGDLLKIGEIPDGSEETMFVEFHLDTLNDFIKKVVDKAREEGRREILSLVEDLEETNLDGEEWWRICSAIEKTIIKLSNKK